jgi:hypothetical protein
MRWLIFCVLAAILLLLAVPAFAHSWYDTRCCSARDCEPLPDGAVTQVSGGYHVKYTGNLGFKVDVIVPHEKALPSRDEKFHGCASVDRFLCLYVPMSV